MSYFRDQDNPMKEHVEKSLSDYYADINNITAGYNILRYAKDKLLYIWADSVDPSCFLDWYPLDQGYVILRLAKEGQLAYKPILCGNRLTQNAYQHL